MYRGFTATISLIILVLLITSCASETSNVNNNTATEDIGENQTISESDIKDNLVDNLGSYDFDEYKFTFFSRDFSTPMFNAALNRLEETGDVLNDELYRRNRRIEERFNIIFDEIVTSDGNTTAARTAVLAGDNSYDVINTRCVYAFDYAQEGLLYSFNDLPEIDLSREYWDQNLKEELTIGNKNYFASGAFNLTSNDFTHVMLFHKGIAEDYQLDDLYTLVTDYKWTFDAMNSMMMQVTHDVNGDGIMDNSDMYGLLSAGKQIPPNLWISAGVRSVHKDNNDLPVFTMASDEKFHQVFEKIYSITWDNGAWFFTSDGANITNQSISMFQNNQALFADMTCYVVKSFRAMDADFGIIPYPLWNEQQDSYYSRIEGCELFCVPVTNANLEMTSVILEALASDSARNVIPAYYEVTLKGKYARDEQSEAMLDIVFNSLVFDYGDTIWCPGVRDGIFAPMYIANNRDLSSKIASLETTINTLIEKTVTAFNELD